MSTIAATARSDHARTDGAASIEVAGSLEALRAAIRAMDGVLVAFSGGVDSSLLAAIAHEQLGDRALAITAVSPIMPSGEGEAATRVAAEIGIRHRLVGTAEMEDERFLANPPDRCYHCKAIRFGALVELARREGLAVVVHGENASDGNDYRPGVRAAVEAGARAPLLELGIDKTTVRAMAAALGLTIADKPASPCLATRIPYGDPITREALAQVDAAETALHALGFGTLRVRRHGTVARVELSGDEAMDRACAPAMRARIVAAVRAAGFRYVALDLGGFRSGSLNEALGPPVPALPGSPEADLPPDGHWHG